MVIKGRQWKKALMSTLSTYRARTGPGSVGAHEREKVSGGLMMTVHLHNYSVDESIHTSRVHARTVEGIPVAARRCWHCPGRRSCMLSASCFAREEGTCSIHGVTCCAYYQVRKFGWNYIICGSDTNHDTRQLVPEQ
eukprot:1144527-Pelagomonas_calceolata.AAC.5